MCIVLDVNSFHDFKDQANEDMEPVRNWLNRNNGKIAYSPTGKFRSEWEAGGGYELMKALQRMGKFKLVPAEDVQAKADALEQIGGLRSDDPHIIALAMLADVKVLVVQRLPNIPRRGGRRGARGADPDLQADFKDHRLVGGKVYITKSHSRLLRKDTCP